MYLKFQPSEPNQIKKKMVNESTMKKRENENWNENYTVVEAKVVANKIERMEDPPGQVSPTSGGDSMEGAVMFLLGF